MYTLKFSISLLLLSGCFILGAQNNNVVINELMSSNSEAIADEEGDFDDWIELFNTTDVPVDISGYGISDDVDALGKFKFPQGTLVPENGYLIIWADDDQIQGPLHVQFKLSASGESVYFTDPNDNILDQVTFGDIPTDLAYARDPNGNGNFVIKAHTHNDNNDLTSSTLYPIPATIEIFPNPTVDVLNIKLDTEEKINSVQLYDALGRVVYSNNQPESNIRIQTKKLIPGNYYLNIGEYKAVLIQKID